MTIYYRAPSWGYRFWSGGQLYKRGGYPTKRDAKEAEWIQRRTLGHPRASGRAVRFEEALGDYVKAVVSQHVNPRGERYAFGLLVKRFGGCPLTSLKSADIAEYARWRLAQPGGLGHGRGKKKKARPITPATVNRDLAYLAAFFNWCKATRLVPDDWPNPARAKSRRWKQAGGVERYDEPWRPWQSLPQEVEARFWAAFPPAERVRAELLLEMGARKGAVLGLTWPQIDWTNRLVHFTSKGRSAVNPLSDRALEILTDLRRQAEAACDGRPLAGRIFPQRSDAGLRRAWAKACATVGLAEFRRHDLRVTHARRLADAGVDLKTISGLLTHSTIAMTSRYIPSDLKARQAAIAKLDARRPLGPKGVRSKS